MHLEPQLRFLLLKELVVLVELIMDLGASRPLS